MARYMTMKYQTGDDERTSGQPSSEWAVWIVSPSPTGGDGDIMALLWPGTGSLSLERRLPRVTASGQPIRDWSAALGDDTTRTARSRRRRAGHDR